MIKKAEDLKHLVLRTILEDTLTFKIKETVMGIFLGVDKNKI